MNNNTHNHSKTPNHNIGASFHDSVIKNYREIHFSEYNDLTVDEESLDRSTNLFGAIHDYNFLYWAQEEMLWNQNAHTLADNEDLLGGIDPMANHTSNYITNDESHINNKENPTEAHFIKKPRCLPW